MKEGAWPECEGLGGEVESFVTGSHQHYLLEWFQVLVMLFKTKRFVAFVCFFFNHLWVNCVPNMILPQKKTIYYSKESEKVKR